MKLYRLIIVAITTLVAIATAVTAVIYFKDEIIDFLDDVKAKLDKKKTLIFHNDEFTDYADI